MNRRTKNPADALVRLAKGIGATVVHVEGTRWLVSRSREGRMFERTGSAKRCLAYLVEVAQFRPESGGAGLTREQVRDIIRLDTITDHGMPGHEWQTVRAVTLAVAEGRR